MNKSAPASGPRSSYPSSSFARARWLLGAVAALASLTACVSHKGVIVRKNGAKPAPVSDGSAMLPAPGVSFMLAPFDKVRVQVLPLSPVAGKPALITVNDTLEFAFSLSATEYRILKGDELTVKLAKGTSTIEFTAVVRPDGRMTLDKPGEIIAAGKTTAELAVIIDQEYRGGLIVAPASSVTVTKSNLDAVEMTGKVVVDADGVISLPKLGRMVAAGKSTEVLADDLAAAARAYFGTELRVSLVRGVSEMKMPGLVGFDGTLVVSGEGLLALPEIGFMPVKGKSVSVVQKEIHEALRAHYPNPLAVVVALEASEARVVYVDGEVGRAGAYPLTPSMTLLKAIALAGGMKETGDLSAVVLIHRNADNDAFVYITNLEEVIEKGARGNDLVLSPQDIVMVPRTSVAKANLWIDQYVTKMLPFSRSVSYSYNEGQTQIK